MMTVTDLRAALAHANLSQLARATGMPLRTLRRLRNGTQQDVLASTVAKLEPHLPKPTKTGKGK